MSRRLALACLVAAALLSAGRAFAGDSRWTALGPWTTGGANALAVDPKNSRNVYASSGPSLFRSTDAGQTWSWTDSGAATYEVGPIAVDPNTPTTVFAGAGDKIVRSEDGGASWTTVYSSERTVVNSLAVDPVDPSTIYAALEHPLGVTPGGVPTPGDVLKSSDGGNHWTLMTSRQFFPAASVVLLDPRIHSTLYVGTFGNFSNAFYRSDNAGRTFQSIPVSSFSCCIRGLAADSAVSGRIYAGLGPGAPDGVLFRSDDRGETWVRADSGLFDASVPYVTAVAVLPGSTVLAATPDGLFESENAGASWTERDAGIEGTVKSLTVPSHGNLAYALTELGVFVSSGSGQAWTRVASPFAPVAVHDVASLPGSGELVAGTDLGVFFSAEGRTGWTESNDGLPAGGVQAVAVAPSRNCADPCSSALFLAGTPNGLYRRSAAGAAWSRFENALFGSVKSIATDPSDADTVYFGTSLGNFARTTNAGSNWSQVRLGSGNPIVALAVDPDAHLTLYATDLVKIFKSTNGGVSWRTLAASFGALSLAAEHGLVYAGSSHGVYVSSDGGSTWRLASDGMTSFLFLLPGISAIATDPRQSSGVFAGSPFDGVFSSSDGASNWSPLVGGLPFSRSLLYPPVDALVAGGEGSTVLAAATPLGIYSLTVVLSSDRNVRPLPQRRPSPPPRRVADRF